MKKIGIDAGGTLTKIAYEEQGKLHVKTYPNDQMDKLFDWLQLIAPAARLFLTGGKRTYLQDVANENSMVVDEFQALTEGTRYLLHEEKGIIDENFVLASIGTGTSIFHVTPEDYERMLGSGIGGGTWMGLGKLISGSSSFQDLVGLANTGDHEKSDLLVRDIYAPIEPPLGGDLTAANFGKAHLNHEADASDHLAALTQLIGETILQLAGQAASMKQVDKIVFVGSTLNGNTKLKNVLKSFQEMIPFEPIFLERGAYAGAIGALI